MDVVTTQILLLCSLITNIAAVATIIIGIVKRAKRPNDIQNSRLDSLEEKVKEHNMYLKNDMERFKMMDAGSRIMQKCMLALLSHNIDGNDVASMKTARDSLQEYLINH